MRYVDYEFKYNTIIIDYFHIKDFNNYMYLIYIIFMAKKNL